MSDAPTVTVSDTPLSPPPVSEQIGLAPAQQGLPVMPADYVFGKHIPRPQTDAQGNITAYPPQTVRGRIVGPNVYTPVEPQVSGPGTATHPEIRPQEGGDVRRAVAQEWLAAGYSPAAVDGILRRIQVESGFDPHAIGDNGTSFGLYQHHADRAMRLAQWAKQNGANPADPLVQTKFAIAEMNGGDPIAARSRPQLMQEKDPGTAYRLFTSAFERGADAPDSDGIRAEAGVGPHLNYGAFSSKEAIAMARAWNDRALKAADQLSRSIMDAKDLHSTAHAMAERWMAETDKPPQNMREAWGTWGSVAGALALFAPAFARGHMTATINAAGMMMQAANSADQKAYDQAYQRWRDHLELGMKAIDMTYRAAKDIVDENKANYDAQIAGLEVLAKTSGILQNLDPGSLQNVQKQFQQLQTITGIIRAETDPLRLKYEKAESDYWHAVQITTAQGDDIADSPMVQAAEANRQQAWKQYEDAQQQARRQYGQFLPGLGPIAGPPSAQPSVSPPGEAPSPPSQNQPGAAAKEPAAAPGSSEEKDAPAGEKPDFATIPDIKPKGKLDRTIYTIQVVQPDGSTKSVPAQHELGKRGMWFTTTTPRMAIDTSRGATPVPLSAGGRLQPGTQRLLGAGSQMEKHLQNLAEMPVDANIGPFFGVESKTPDTLAEGLVRASVRKTGIGGADAKRMQIEFIGVSRQIATLDAQGVGQGLVGLSQQAEGYAPLPGDSPEMVLRKYASLRQIVEQAMVSVLRSGTANPDQRRGAQEIMDNVQRAIPITVHDLNAIVYAKGADQHKAARAVADRMLGREAAAGHADLPHVSSDADYAKVPAGGRYIAPDGKTYTKGQ